MKGTTDVHKSMVDVHITRTIISSSEKGFHTTYGNIIIILIFPNKTPPSDIYFNIIIIQLNSSTYNFFGIFK
jgi:hypothetical protein